MPEASEQFYMDFGFLRASPTDYRQPDTVTDHIVTSFDGFQSYLLIMYNHTRHVWVFLTKSKDPPADMVKDFLKRFGRNDEGLVR